MNEYMTKNRKTNGNDEDSKGNEIDQKYITCTHVDKEWGKDFAGTTEPVALCTPPWHVLREALFGIVQSMKQDDENNHNKDHRDDVSRPPVDIAYVVVVNAAARVKTTHARPRRRSMLPASIMAKFENHPDHTTTTTGLQNEHVTLDQADRKSTLSCDPPKYKLVIDGDDNENHKSDDDDNTKHHRMVEINANVKCPPIIETSLPNDTTTSFTTETNRPKFRLCVE